MPDQRERLEELRARARYEELRQRAGLSEPPAPDNRFETARQGTYNLMGQMADRAQAVPLVGGAASAGLNAAREIAMGDQANRQSATPGFLGQAAKGAAFNFADELQGGLAAGVQPLRNVMGEGVSPGEAYRAQTQAARDDQRQTMQDYPVTSTALQVGGGALAGGGLVSGARTLAPGMVAAGANMARQSPMLASALAGLSGGAVAGYGEGETPADRRFGALAGGATGAALGALSPALLGAARNAGTQIMRAVGRQADDVPQGVRQVLRQVPDETRAELADNAGENAPAFMGELLGARGERIMTDLAQGDDAAANFARMAARQRAAERSQRVMAEVQMRTGSRRGVNAIADVRQAEQTAIPLFRQVDQSPVPVSGRLREIVRRAASEGVNIPGTSARQQSGELRLDALLSDDPFDGAVSGQTVRALIADIQDAKTTAFRQGGGNAGGRLATLERDLRGYLGEQVPAFRQASSIWRDARLDDEAFRLGTSVFDEGKNRAFIETQLRDFMGDASDLSASERGQFMAGVLDAIERRTASTAAGGNAGSRLTREGIQDRLAIVFGDDEARALSDVLSREAYTGSLDRLYDPTVGSQTAPRQNSQGAVDEALRGRGSRFAAGVVEDVRGGTLGRGRQALARSIREASPQQRQQLAEMMFAPSNDSGASTLARMIEQERRRAGLFGGTAAAGSFLAGQQAASSR